MSDFPKLSRQAAIEYALLGAIFECPEKRIPEAVALGAHEGWFMQPPCRLAWAAIMQMRVTMPDAAITPLPVEFAAEKIAADKNSPHYGTKLGNAFLVRATDFHKERKAPSEVVPCLAGYAAHLRNERKSRECARIFKAAAEEVDGGKRLAKMQAGLRKLDEEETPNSTISVAELVKKALASARKAHEEVAVNRNYGYIPGIPWPFEKCNRLTGGLLPGLHVIAARPSVGKTSFIMQCMAYWCMAGYRVAFNSLDMAPSEAIKRPIANLSDAALNRVDHGGATDEEMERYAFAAEEVIAWETTERLTIVQEYDVDKLKAWASLMHAAGKLDVLVIDFAQRFRLASGGSSEYETVTHASGILKQLANECNLPVVLLSQLSRDSQKSKDGPRAPELSDLRGSGALEQDATTVVLLHKPEEVNKGWKSLAQYGEAERAQMDKATREAIEAATRELDLLVPYGGDRKALAAVHYELAKNQNGPTGEVPFVVFQSTFRWYVGDAEAGGKAQYRKITLDWRAAENELRNATKNEVAVEPEHWQRKYIEELGKLGLPLPDSVKADMTQWDADRYEKLLAERKARLNEEN